jgi:hypothetical protein
VTTDASTTVKRSHDPATMAEWERQTEEDLYAAAASAATAALAAYNPESGRLPFPDPGMYGDDLNRAIGGAARELDEIQFSWKDGYCGSEEFLRARAVMHAAWSVVANARTWSGRADAPQSVVSAWLGLHGETGDQT